MTFKNFCKECWVPVLIGVVLCTAVIGSLSWEPFGSVPKPVVSDRGALVVHRLTSDTLLVLEAWEKSLECRTPDMGFKCVNRFEVEFINK